MSARRATSKKAPPPEPGTVFAMPLEDGRFGVCRVLAHDPPMRGASDPLVAEASSWVGDMRPSLEDVTPWRVLVLSHHAHKGTPERIHVDGPPPASFVAIGTLVLDDDARLALETPGYSGWGSFPLQRLLQWRWDHDRAAVLVEDTLKERAKRADAEEARELEAKRKAELSLAKLRRKTPFASWKGHVKPPLIAKSRELVLGAIDGLAELGKSASAEKKIEALRAMIEGFNDLDGDNDCWITTIEREDICAVFYDIVAAAKLEAEDDLADRWRDW